jgi:hypothetical protein
MTYEKSCYDFCDYLKRQNTEDSIQERINTERYFTTFKDNVIQCIQRIKTDKKNKLIKIMALFNHRGEA